MPATLATRRWQERVGLPSTCTVHAPHWAMPQPYFVPFMSSTSRNTQSNGMSSETSTETGLPFTLNETAIGRPSAFETSGNDKTRRYTGSGVLTGGTIRDSPAIASAIGVEAAGLSNSPSQRAITTVAKQLP